MSQHIFVCHASEDKPFVRPLVEHLRTRGARVWYDESNMRLGSSLRESIDEGLANCSFGVVILSPAFFKKKWTQRELNGLVAREMTEGRKLILPVWYGADRELIVQHSPPLADVLGIVFDGDFEKVSAAILQRLRLDDPYIQFSGRQYVRVLDDKGLQAKIIIEKNVQVGNKPLTHMEVRISPSGETTVEHVTPGISKGVRHEGGSPMLTIAYAPPIESGTTFTQTIVFDAPNIFCDPENFVNVIPALPYEYFILGVETTKSNMIKTVRAFKTVGKTDSPLTPIIANEDQTEYSIRLVSPEVGYRHALVWTW